MMRVLSHDDAMMMTTTALWPLWPRMNLYVSSRLQGLIRKMRPVTETTHQNALRLCP